MDKYRIIHQPTAFSPRWYMTNLLLDGRWTQDRYNSMSFANRKEAEAFLTRIGHTGLGVKIVPESYDA